MYFSIKVCNYFMNVAKTKWMVIILYFMHFELKYRSEHKDSIPDIRNGLDIKRHVLFHV